MKPKKIKFEDMKGLNNGDLIIMNDPAFQKAIPYVFMSNDNDTAFHFVSGYGASLMINCQDTIDGYNVRLIDEKHPSWDGKLSAHGKDIGDMLDKVIESEGIDIEDMFDTFIKS